MKTIFRLTNLGLLLAALLAFGAVAGLAQDPCQDADGQTKMQDEFDALYKQGRKAFDARKKAIESGKSFVDKYGSCEAAKARTDWLKTQIPIMEKNLSGDQAGAEKEAVLGRFDASLKGKNWDDAYTAGDEILSKYGEELRTAEIVLAAIAGEEAFKGNNKYNDKGLKYIKQSISDLEANKPFKVGEKTQYGVSLKDSYNFEFTSKDDALGWMNLYLGYITAVGQKNRQGALPQLYKATQGSSSSTKSPAPYDIIGGYYSEELNKLVDQIQAKAKDQKDTDPPDVAQKKVDEIEALVAQSNGIAERVMDAYARAYTLSKDAAYKTKAKKIIEDAYNVRFGKREPVDTWISSAVSKPFPDPTSPVQPISDPKPAKTTTGDAAVGAPAGPGATAKPGTTAPATGAKPAGTTTTTTTTTKPTGPIKPANKPGTSR